MQFNPNGGSMCGGANNFQMANAAPQQMGGGKQQQPLGMQQGPCGMGAQQSRAAAFFGGPQQGMGGYGNLGAGMQGPNFQRGPGMGGGGMAAQGNGFQQPFG